MSIVKSSLNNLDYTVISISNSLSIRSSFAKIGALINLENKFVSVKLQKTTISNIVAEE